MTGIYLITNTINGKRYIGQSIDIKRRFWDHRCLSHESNRHMRHAMQKYGKEAFKYEVIEECEPEDLNERERFWISELKPEYNCMDGGQARGKKHSAETIRILREKWKASWANKTDAEKKTIITENLKGPRAGHSVSEETRKKLRDRNIGKKQSKETVRKRMLNIAEKKKHGYVQTNSNHRKKVVCIETGMVFDSIKQAAEYLCVRPSGITSMLRGRQKSIKGFRFKYLEV